MNNPSLTSLLLASCLALASPVILFAQEDPVEKALVDPDLIMVHRDQIGMSDAQIETIHALFEKASPYFEEREEKLREMSIQLGKTLEADPIEEAKVLEQLDKMMDTERQIRRKHMQVMIQLKKQLTPAQLAAARKVQKELPANYRQVREETAQRLESKIDRIRQGLEVREQAGDPSVEAVQLMDPVPKMMERGRFKEVEAVLDRVLKLLGLEEKK